jgi:glycine cleavage system aminomethyltransferase T
MQVQGPMSAKTLEKLVGSAIYDIKYYWCENFDIDGIPVLISRTGWTAIPGFEVNLLDYSKGDALWDAVAGAGEEFGIKPIAPCEARRIEGGIFNYGSDMTLLDTPMHIMGLERLIEDQPQDYIGKAALEKLKANGVDRKLVGVELPGDQLRAELSRVWDVVSGGKAVGKVTDAVWSPGLQKNIGYVWVPIEMAEPGTKLEIVTERGEHIEGMTASIPFVDPRKEAPAAKLA